MRYPWAMPRPRKSIQELNLAGAYRPGRHRGRENAPAAGPPLADLPVPASLTPHQAMVWHQVVAALPAGVVRAADVFTVEAFVVALDTFRQAARTVALEGTVAPGSKAQMAPSGPLRVMMMAMDRLHAIGSRLGMDPQSRLKMCAAPEAPPPAAEDDPWAIFEPAVARASRIVAALPPVTKRRKH